MTTQNNISPYIFPGLKGGVQMKGAVPRIIQAVSETTGVEYPDIAATGTTRPHTTARHLLLYIMRQVYPRLTLTELSQRAVGRVMDHSTVHHALQNVAGWREMDSEMAATIQRIEGQIADLLPQAA